MIALLVTTLLAAGAGLGWYAHRAYQRIDTWGRNMNDCDAIFRFASEEEVDGALRRIRAVRFDEAAPANPMARQPL